MIFRKNPENMFNAGFIVPVNALVGRVHAKT